MEIFLQIIGVLIVVELLAYCWPLVLLLAIGTIAYQWDHYGFWGAIANMPILGVPMIGLPCLVALLIWLGYVAKKNGISPSTSDSITDTPAPAAVPAKKTRKSGPLGGSWLVETAILGRYSVLPGARTVARKARKAGIPTAAIAWFSHKED